MIRSHLLWLFIFTTSFGFAAAQPIILDTANTTLSHRDTTKSPTNTSIDTLVTYSAKDSIIYSLRTRYMNLYGKSEMQYQTIDLKSERVNVNWDNATLIAYGAADTAKVDSVIGKPIMRDGGDEYHGDQVRYNFQTKKGKITIGNTQMDNGYYVGANIKKVEPNVLCVADGTYTTCDEKDPHFRFESPKMKVFVRDKVVAEPVYFFIADVPVFALPFGVFPAHGGRSSGIITPAYGEDARFGWYLSHFGYYWAVSDYWDIASMFDIYSRGRWQNQTNIRYALRYNFGGSITARITSTPEGEPSDPNYTKTRQYYVNITHGQQISPSSHLDINFTFMSNDYFRKYSLNLNNILQQNIISTATYWKNWEKSNQSLSASVSRDQNLLTDETNEVLPSVSFSQGTFFPFRKTMKTRGLTSGSEAEMGFIEMLGFSYTVNANNNQSKVVDVDTVKSQISSDTLDIVSNFKRSRSQALNQYVSISLSPKFGHFTVSPSLSFSDSRSWADVESPIRNSIDSLLDYTTTRTKVIRGSVTAGVNTSTRFYGLFQPNIFSISAIRHTVTPSFGIFYNKQIYGDYMQKYSMTGSFNIGNNFEMKIQKNDSANTENKIQLINITAGTSYNFVADSMNFSPVNVGFRTDIGQYLGIAGSAAYNLYVYDPAASNGRGARVNKFLLKEAGKFGDLTSFSLSLSTSFRGEKKQKPAVAGIPENVLQEQEKVSGQSTATSGQRKIFQSIYDREDADFSIPWNINVSFNFSQSQPTPQYYSRSSSMNASLSFNLTEKWQISTSGTYDFVRKQHFIPSVSVTRDLHCWQMSFSWQPMGVLEGYRFELKVKAPQLQDIKITKQRSAYGVYP
jgi:lipopolysaccharide assembly outer membrane protein LptD (OstA)